jgi:hypothetical protein
MKKTRRKIDAGLKAKLPRSLLSLVPSGLMVDRLLPTPDRILSLRARAAPALLAPCAPV